MAKKMIIKGVGTFLAKRFDPQGKGAEVITLGNLQNLRITFETTMEDIFGGDSLFAIDQLVSNKQITVEATDAKFDLAALQLMMGSALKEQVNDYVWQLGEKKLLKDGVLDTASSIAVAEATVQYGTSIYNDGNFTVRLSDENKILSRVPLSTTAAPNQYEFMVDTATGRVILNSTHVGKGIEVSYQRTAMVDVVNILKDEIPFPVHVIHHGAFLQKDGTYQGVETELYSCIPNGSFTLDAARAQASASSVNLRILDPERPDCRIGTVKRFVADKMECAGV